MTRTGGASMQGKRRSLRSTPGKRRSLHFIGRVEIWREKASWLDAGRTAVRVTRWLAARSVWFEPVFANQLLLLGYELKLAGRYQEALTVLDEAVRIARPRAGGRAVRGVLAYALKYQASALGALGRWNDAVCAADESVQLLGGLVIGRPARYGPDLVDVQYLLGASLVSAGRTDEAVSVVEREVGIRRRLAAANPEYEDGLARSLLLYGYVLDNLGRLRDGLPHTEEAVRILRRLAADDASTYDDRLAGALYRVASGLRRCGNHDEGRAIAAEAVAIYRRLVRTDSDTHEPALASVLLELSLLEQRPADRRRHAEEAERIWRRRAAGDGGYDAGRANALQVRVRALREEGQTDEARACAAEAVALLRRLAESDPNAYELGLILALRTLGRIGESAQRLPHLEEAVHICRRSMMDGKATFDPYLADLLDLTAACLGDCGRPGDGRMVATEAVAVYRVLAESDPNSFEPGLAHALGTLTRLGG